MKVAVVAPPYLPIPPSGYGGVERVVSLLVEQLSRAGHEVTLFALEGSSCSGTTVGVPPVTAGKVPTGFRSKKDIFSEERVYDAMREHLAAHPVDVIHDWTYQNLFVKRHPEEFPFVISTCIPPGPGPARPNLVACSKAHADLCGGSTRFVHYGLHLSDWPYSARKNGHLVHIAKIARYKAQHVALKAARRAGKSLVLAGNIEDKWYFLSRVRPQLWLSPGASYVGEIQGTSRHLLDASALVQTPRWFDAFPLVVLEALACGTPVIATVQGGIAEQVVSGVNGYLCNTFDDLVSAMERVGDIRPEDCRAYAEEHFSVARMADNYVRLYEQVRDGVTW